MRNVLFLFMFLVPILAFSQGEDAKVKFAEYKKNSVYKVEGNNVVVAVVLENVNGTKDELYLSVKNYFARFYSDPNSVLKVDDKEGGILEVESVYFNFYEYTADLTIPVKYHAFYEMKVDVNNDKLLVVCSASDWIVEWSTIGNDYKAVRYPIVDCVPLGNQDVFSDMNNTMDAFLALVDKMYTSVDTLEKSLMEGNIAEELED